MVGSLLPGDPVELGLVASFARSGGNLTGLSVLNVKMNPKRVGAAVRDGPQAKVIALLVNQNNPNTKRNVETCSLRRAQGRCSSISWRPVTKTRSIPLSQPSFRCEPARSSSLPTRSSTADATSS
jgi:hypothetical protein